MASKRTREYDFLGSPNFNSNTFTHCFFPIYEFFGFPNYTLAHLSPPDLGSVGGGFLQIGSTHLFLLDLGFHPRVIGLSQTEQPWILTTPTTNLQLENAKPIKPKGHAQQSPKRLTETC
ncbi:hypothetical protein RJ641_035022 [Dillenia turbinata]|uniref:Uncharacterized protein n=1 Tax=Dillenia turbinata TaxID=194707 RepID=A0AAN8VSD6_9MAGN